MGKETWEEQFDKEFVNDCGHLDFKDEDGFLHLQKPTKIKQFIKTTLNDMLDEIVGEDLPRYEQQDFLFHRDEYNWGYNDCIKQIKAKGLKYISK